MCCLFWSDYRRTDLSIPFQCTPNQPGGPPAFPRRGVCAYTGTMRILLVEDHVELSHWVSKALRDANLTVECAATGADADTLLHTQDYALVILDLTLPRMDGMEVLRRLRARGGT